MEGAQLTGVARHGFLEIRVSYAMYETSPVFIEGCALN